MHHITGPSATFPYLFIDIDYIDLDFARIAANSFDKFLRQHLNSNQYAIFFSGSKGFHFFISASAFLGNAAPTEELFGPYVQKAIVKLIQSRIPGVQFDYNIYSRNRLVRACNSINLKSNNYKIPVLSRELEGSIETIIALSKSPRDKNPSELARHYTTFKVSSNCTPPFGELHATALQRVVEPKSRARSSVRQNISELPLDDPAQFRSAPILEKCRALRNLASKIRTTRQITTDERLALARGLAESDQQARIVHELFSRTEKYSPQLTNAKLIEKGQFAISCDALTELGICKSPCTRYLTKEARPGKSPSYFGDTNRGLWGKFVSLENIATTAAQLVQYHKTTTDLFDWANALQFEKNPFLFREAIFDNLSKGQLADQNCFLINVSKGAGRNRQLAMVHFETELALSLFAPLMIKDNSKFHSETLANNVHSFGYLGSDENASQLIKPWFFEYSAFKKTRWELSKLSGYELYYNDDLVDFYPSITAQLACRLVDEMVSDPRISNLLKLFFSKKFSFLGNPDQTDHVGLPQGPLISHILAARLLLKIDRLIASRFTREELVLVRYCDDFVFFVRDEATLKTLRFVVIPEIEAEFGIRFHKDEKSRKTKTGTIEDFRTDRSEQDFLRYQIQFESELAEVDEDTRRELLDLVAKLFGKYDTILRTDPHFNLKDIELQLSALKWRVPLLLSENANLDLYIRKLSRVLINCLTNPNISYKFQTTLILIYTSIIDHVEQGREEYSAVFIDTLKATQNEALLLNSFLQLQRIISTNDSRHLMQLGQELVTRASNPAHSPAVQDCRERLKLLIAIRYDKGPLSFDPAAWGRSRSAQFGVSESLSRIHGALRDPDNLLALLKSSESEFSFYVQYIQQWLKTQSGSLPIKDLASIYNVAFEFDLRTVKDILRSKVPDFVAAELVTDSAHRDYLSTTSHLTASLQSIFKCDEGSVEFLMYNNNSTLLSFKGMLLSLEAIPIHRISTAELRHYESVLARLRELPFSDQFYLHLDAASKELLAIVRYTGARSVEQIVPYLSKKNSTQTLCEAEAAFFSSTSTSSNISPVFSAKNLGIVYGPKGPRLSILSLLEVFTDTRTNTYVFASGQMQQLHKKHNTLPGFRLFEQYRLTIEDHDSEDFRYGAVGFSLIKLLDPSRFTAKYCTPRRAVHILENIVEYIRENVDKEDFSKVDRMYMAAYNQTKSFKKLTPTSLFRKNLANGSPFFATFFSNLRILSQLEYKSGPGQVDQFHSLCLSDAPLAGLRAYPEAPSLNYLAALTILLSAADLDRNLIRHDHQRVFSIVQLSGFYLLLASIFELHTVFGSVGDRFSLLRDVLLRDFRTLRKAMNKNFPLPNNCDTPQVNEALKQLALHSADLLKAAKHPAAPKLFRIRTHKLHPDYTTKDESKRMDYVSKDFASISLEFDIQERGKIRWALGMAKRWLATWGAFEAALPFTAKLSRDLSPLHNWGGDSHLDIPNSRFVSIDRNRRRLIINSVPHPYVFFPRNFRVGASDRSSYIYAALLLILITALGFAQDNILKPRITSYIKSHIEFVFGASPAESIVDQKHSGVSTGASIKAVQNLGPVDPTTTNPSAHVLPTFDRPKTM